MESNGRPKIFRLLVLSNLASLLITTFSILLVRRIGDIVGRTDQGLFRRRLLIADESFTNRSVQEQECCRCFGPLETLTCPAQEGSIDVSTTTSIGEVRLIRSGSNVLCTLVQVSADGASLKPLGRSYDGFGWEAYRGDLAAQTFRCSTDSCVTVLPSLPAGAKYQLTTFHAPPLVRGQQDVIARFLEQATFGPTRGSIASLDATNPARSFANWIMNQQESVPMTSHRATFRTRLNGRMEVATRQGAVTHPCQKGTRYRRAALTSRDRYIDITTIGMKVILKVDGFVRTVVDGPITLEEDQSTVIPDDSYYLNMGIAIHDKLGGRFGVSYGDGFQAVAFGGGSGGIPSIKFDAAIGANPNVLLTLSPSLASPIDSQFFQADEVKDQEIILTKDLSMPVCSTLGETGNPINPVFALFNGNYYIHDPRYELLDNTLESPANDGGGKVMRDTANIIQAESSARCANAPRTFLNEETCFLSFDPVACTFGDAVDEENLPPFFIDLSPAALRRIYEITGGGTGSTHYLYSVNGLRVADDTRIDLPCQRETRSRFIPVSCSGSAASLESTFHKIFSDLLSWQEESDRNPFLRDIWNNHDEDCPAPMFQTVGFEVADHNGKCWKHVHPNHLDVFDFTEWTREHPGNSRNRNPIKEFADKGRTELWYPHWHEMTRWSAFSDDYGHLRAGRLGDKIHYYLFPRLVRSHLINDPYFGFEAERIAFEPSNGVIICGSPFEIANNLSLGGSLGRGAYSSIDFDHFDNDDIGEFMRWQKHEVWTDIVLKADDQLRQRMAWTLSQILVVSLDEDNKLFTESATAYYDIFVRHAFGRYRDILKEVSYSPMMAETLTYHRSKSTAYVWLNERKVQYADENFAREIMQLFTTGLSKLNQDGTQIMDGNGNPVPVYTNDDIVEYARVWTGFEAQPRRGNIEVSYSDNMIDPMNINMAYRDIYPKMGLDRTYIGDGVPLCADLPLKHFLKKGATYRLLGGTSTPKLIEDPIEWQSDSRAKRFSLKPNSGLLRKLCGSQNLNACKWASKVVLNESVSCVDEECLVDTVRVIEVTKGIFYEYRPPRCVYQAFFDKAKVLKPRWDSTGFICADPKTIVATPACCNSEVAEWNDMYWGERTTAASAELRCNGLCDGGSQPSCDESSVGTYCYDNAHFWTSETCTLRVKIDSIGNAAIVHAPTGYSDTDVSSYLQQDTKTFFRVDWTGDWKTLASNCNSIASCSQLDDGMCVCDVYVTQEEVFPQSQSLPSRDEVLNMLNVGAFDPALSDATYSNISRNGVTRYTQNGIMNTDTIFEVTDNTGRRHFRKNIKSTVHITGSNVSFRNPVHFISFADPELYQAEDETDEALDHYVYHANTAPFLAFRIAQRFGISNPSPDFIKRIASAFRTGFYSFVDGQSQVRFGSGEYGDLAATIACILMDREARTVILDADPIHGGMKEPLVKVISTMRALEFQLDSSEVFVQFRPEMSRMIGQMAHELPNVFSFFLPEYKPSGPISLASMVSPEAQVLVGPRIVDTLNGMLSLLKYGMTDCFDGFFSYRNDREQEDCDALIAGSGAKFGQGQLTFAPSTSVGASLKSIVDELATLLTGGRLSLSSRELIENIVSTEPNQSLAIVKAQQLIALTPEFHTTNLVRKSGKTRPELQAPPRSNKPYKAVVYIYLSGAMDSFNMLAPHTCARTNSAGQTLLEQYHAERTNVAINDNERSRIVQARNQPCDEFVIHEDLEIVEKLYKAGDLAFFANAGLLDEPVTKENYQKRTRTELFSHPTMKQGMEILDPFVQAPGTGILGRMCDVLTRKGFRAQPITVNDANVATVGVPGVSVDPLFVSSNGGRKLNPKPNAENFDPIMYMDQLNDETTLQSSVYSETWSQNLLRAVFDNTAVTRAIETTLPRSEFPASEEAQKLKVISTLMASHDQRGTDRDVFYAEFGGYDHHGDLKRDLSDRFRTLNGALTAFSNEMKAHGLWDNVSVVVTSEFARTLTSNSGGGSDHGWGGHYFIMGGSVKGGQIHGEYPADITSEGPLNIGRGRIIPTLSWESIFHSVVEWMGLDTPSELDSCLPNREKTGTKLFRASEVFE